MKEQFINEVYAEREQPVGQCVACGHFDVILSIISQCNVCTEEIVMWDKEIKIANSCPNCIPNKECLCKCHAMQVKEQITDTDRLDFIAANDAIVQTDVEPYCKCCSCWAWSIEVGNKKYYEGSLRDAIDAAMKDTNK